MSEYFPGPAYLGRRVKVLGVNYIFLVMQQKQI